MEGLAVRPFLEKGEMVHFSQWKVDERVEQGQIRAINAQHMHEQLAGRPQPAKHSISPSGRTTPLSSLMARHV